MSAPPKLSVTDIVKSLKGITGRKLFEKYSAICQKLGKGQLWNHSYYVETIGNITDEAVQKYIKEQAEESRKEDSRSTAL